MEDITFQILKIVVSVASALIAAYLIPYIKAKTSDARYKEVVDMVSTAVRAAEQTITGSGMGAVKKSEVLAFVSSWLGERGINLTDDHLEMLLESAVYSMKQAQEG